jgi:hypothetical protein
MSELQEFYPYSEMPDIGKLPGLFEESFKTGERSPMIIGH